MVELSKADVKNFKVLYIESHQKLSGIVGGRVDQKNPLPITKKNASCDIARVMFNITMMMNIVNKAEGLATSLASCSTLPR